MDSNYNVQFRIIGSRSNIGLINIRGSLDTLLAYELKEQSNSLIKDGIYHYIINLEHLEYVSSAGIEFFHSLADTLRKNNGKILFTNVPQKIYRLFEMIGLTSIFRIKSTIREAMQELEFQ